MASHPATTAQPSGRVALVRRGRQLAWFTIGWNALEGLVAIAAGLAAGSIALLGFGADSYVEVFAGSVVLWRLAAERRGQEVSEAAERRAVRLIACTFFVLAVGVAAESTRTLLLRERPQESLPGIVLAVVSLAVMPLLARAKRRVGRQLGAKRSRPTPPRRLCACGCRPSCWPG
jgi:divalent metal cation (Fe/Co/Zn/Cd) transporter